MHLEFAVLSISSLKQSFKVLHDKETDVATETETNKATSDSRGQHNKKSDVATETEMEGKTATSDSRGQHDKLKAQNLEKNMEDFHMMTFGKRIKTRDSLKIPYL
jgi:hypothetical protein